MNLGRFDRLHHRQDLLAVSVDALNAGQNVTLSLVMDLLQMMAALDASSLSDLRTHEWRLAENARAVETPDGVAAFQYHGRRYAALDVVLERIGCPMQSATVTPIHTARERRAANGR